MRWSTLGGAEIILGMRSANEGRRRNAMSFLIDGAHTHNYFNDQSHWSLNEIDGMLIAADIFQCIVLN